MSASCVKYVYVECDPGLFPFSYHDKCAPCMMNYVYVSAHIIPWISFSWFSVASISTRQDDFLEFLMINTKFPFFDIVS